MPTITTETTPYELLFRWNDGALAGAHVQFVETIRKDGAVISQQVGHAHRFPGIGGEESPYHSTLAIPGAQVEMTTSRDVLEALSSGAGPRRVLVTLGYSGWGAGQLEDEIGRNGWLTVDAEPGLIFDTPVEQRYDKALSLLGVDPKFLMSEAGHA